MDLEETGTTKRGRGRGRTTRGRGTSTRARGRGRGRGRKAKQIESEEETSPERTETEDADTSIEDKVPETKQTPVVAPPEPAPIEEKENVEVLPPTSKYFYPSRRQKIIIFSIVYLTNNLFYIF